MKLSPLAEQGLAELVNALRHGDAEGERRGRKALAAAGVEEDAVEAELAERLAELEEEAEEMAEQDPPAEQTTPATAAERRKAAAGASEDAASTPPVDRSTKPAQTA